MAEQNLSKDKLQTAEAVLSLGLIVVRELHDKGMAIIFMNEHGDVEMCPMEEIMLDLWDEEDVIAKLLDRGYTDEQLLGAIKGRRAREVLRNGQDM